jgi:predicted secreted acid phosphatase
MSIQNYQVAVKMMTADGGPRKDKSHMVIPDLDETIFSNVAVDRILNCVEGWAHKPTEVTNQKWENCGIQHH